MKPAPTWSTTAALDAWATSLRFLDDTIAAGVSQMAQRLDLVMAADSPASAGADEPNGYGGISQSGDLGRLLLSDWALAELEPEEFLRRFVTSELSYLEIEHEAPRPPPAIAVVIDSGPEQLGARRLVQLAGLVTLDRRARSLGIPLMLGVFGDSNRTWHQGELADLFATWLRARSAETPPSVDLDPWLEDTPAETTAWFFGGPAIDDAALDPRWRRLSAIESRWSDAGATHLEATIDQRVVELPLPDPQHSVRLLRGRGLRREQRTPATEVTGNMRFPQMPGAPRRVMCRGATDDHLWTFTVPQHQHRPTGKVKQYTFPGSVLAATFVASRTVALVSRDDRLTVSIIGKRLGLLDTIDMRATDVGLDEQSIDRICREGLGPLYFHSGSLIVQLEEQWWQLTPPDEARERSFVAVAPSVVNDQARLLPPTVQGYDADGTNVMPIVDRNERALLGPESTVLIEETPGVWRDPSDDGETIRIDPTSSVYGLTARDQQPALVTKSPGGHMIRLVGPRLQTTTLTKWSSDVAHVAVHPIAPLIAIQRSNGTIEVLDVSAEATLLARVVPESAEPTP